MRGRLSALFLGLIVSAAACGGGGDAGPTGTPPVPVPPPPPVTPPPPATPPPPPAGRVEPPFGSDLNFDIVDDSFVDPQGRHDQEGQGETVRNRVVSWTQNGQNIHRVEFSKVPAGADMMDSGDIRPGQIWEFRPKVAGTYVFFCRYHEYMMDVKIIVAEN